MLTDEVRYKLLKLVEANPALNQRGLARELGISLGKVNFCLHALIDKGLVKASNFKNSHNKRSYLYVLTPQGVEDKARVTVRFLRNKQAEFEALKQEIAALQIEASTVQIMESTDLGRTR